MAGASTVRQTGSVRVSLVQFAAATDKSENLAAIRRLVPEAVESRPDLVVLPEVCMHDFGPPDMSLGPVAEPLDGPFVSALAGLAREHAIHLVAGVIEQSDDSERPYNTLVALRPDGTVAGSYRKLHLYDSFGYRESDKLLPVSLDGSGSGATTVDVAGVRVGLMTCYDLRFPELSRVLVDAGADALCVPSAWVRGPLKEGHWETLLRARALENTAYVVAAAQHGKKYCGRSMVVDPMGVAVAELGEAEGTIAGEVSGRRIDEVRKTNPALTHRRFEVRPAP